MINKESGVRSQESGVRIMANATLSGVGIKININIPYSLLSSRTKLNSLVERGNREQGTGNRKISCVINSVPLLNCHLSPVTCHLSPVTCHLSPVPCHLYNCFSLMLLQLFGKLLRIGLIPIFPVVLFIG